MYEPDNWVIVKIIHPSEIIYKILAGWNGGYLDPSSWRLNSGITKVEEDGDFILFSGYSGSIYRCHKGTETLRSNCAYIFAELEKQYVAQVSRISYVDFLKEFPHESVQDPK